MKHEDAVSDVIGSSLMVGITVIMMAGVALLLMGQDGPDDIIHGDLDFSVNPGGNGWGNGDENVLLRHRGGEPVSSTDLLITILVNDTATEYSGGALDQGFSDGQLALGESWRATLTIEEKAAVKVIVRSGSGGSSQNVGPGGLTIMTVASTALATATNTCLDTADPSILSWSHDTNITTAIDGPVTFTVEATDDCGIDSVAPTLWYRINNGSSPPYTDGGKMTLDGNGRFALTWNGPQWSLYPNQTFEAYASPIYDDVGNSTGTTNLTDYIEEIIVDFPYHDLNCDGAYDSSEPNLTTEFSADPVSVSVTYCMVLPAAMGDVLKTKAITLTAQEITTEVAIKAGTDLTLTANAGPIRATGQPLEASIVYLNADTAYLNGTTLTGDFDVDTTGDVWVHNASWSSHEGSHIIVVAGDIHAQDSSFVHTASNKDIRFDTNGDIYVQNTLFDVSKSLVLDVTDSANTVYVQGATFQDSNNEANLLPNTANVVGTPAFGGIA